MPLSQPHLLHRLEGLIVKRNVRLKKMLRPSFKKREEHIMRSTRKKDKRSEITIDAKLRVTTESAKLSSQRLAALVNAAGTTFG